MRRTSAMYPCANELWRAPTVSSSAHNLSCTSNRINVNQVRLVARTPRDVPRQFLHAFVVESDLKVNGVDDEGDAASRRVDAMVGYVPMCV